MTDDPSKIAAQPRELLGIGCPQATARLVCDGGRGAHTLAFACESQTRLILVALVMGSIVMFEKQARQ